ncbi:hypothetical protein [Flavobacterium sp. 22076]|jgi:hypothetical protein|uniref:hypothetical protein n=1 Tax=unclassified Flavobacterium TaxID=196869 RepID=UPI003F83E811
MNNKIILFIVLQIFLNCISLSANNDGNKLIFNQLRNLEGNDLGSTMKPEFILIEQGGKYYIQSEWIDSEFINKKKQPRL